MNAIDFHRAYEEENKRDYVASATLGAMVSIALNLFCILMDYRMYPDKLWLFVKVRLSCVLLVGLVWAWYKSPLGGCPRRLFGVTWFLAPLIMILWMVYAADDPMSPYYAGLNIVLLALGLISPWTYIQNLLTTLFVLVMYLVVVFLMPAHQPVEVIINNTTFLVLTAVLVVCGSVASARLRYREFSLRFELEENRKIIEENNRRLVELDHAKSRFFANISHELRTPLTLLLAPLDALRTRFGGLLDKEGQELILVMRDNGMRLLKLINDLLDLVRLEEGRVRIERVSLSLESFVRGVAASVQHTAATREVELVVEVEPGLPDVMLDRDKLEKTLLNLLFNALKFTDAGGRVTLNVVRRGEELVFAVRDTGIGISEENQTNLFQRFWQADGSSHRKHQGAGIGLSLVKEFTEAQGGSVEVESELGRGATFSVRLPFVVASEPAETEGETLSRPGAEEEGATEDSWLQSLYHEAQLSPAGGSRTAGSTALYARRGMKPSTVLVADDEPDMLRFIRAQLGVEHRVVSAKNGRIAVELAGLEKPAVIVMDMMMPEMDGIEACEAIRKNPATAHIPIVMLTARADEDTKLAALAAGANDFIVKPFSVTELHVRVQNLMETYHSRLDLAEQNQTLEETLDTLRETEMQLLQSEKLASLGELSAGMSHEVKNPLNYALTGVYALRNRAAVMPASERDDYTELVATVEEGIRRVMDTVNTLRELVHPQVENRQDFKVGDAVDAALRLLSAEWRGWVTVHKDIDPGAVLNANKSMILLVFLNLFKNSMDALRERQGGEAGPELWITAGMEANMVVIRVRDNGPGITEANQSKVFDILGMGDEAGAVAPGETSMPGRVFTHFFSTKKPGQGMGMGLSICRRIVRAHEGRISFRSEPGQLCEFIVEFPVRQPVEVVT